MQHEQQRGDESPAGGGGVGRPVGPHDPAIAAPTRSRNGAGDDGAELLRAPFDDARLALASETVPSEQLWRAAIQAARNAAALAADLRRQLATRPQA